mmetsp:Transcript_15537/g.52438  ORF Transcript_15537/g.52438 Transcript_15537/m.52438 type:complete len:210 (-) Transcript_15537:553-1182(-)
MARAGSSLKSRTRCSHSRTLCGFWRSFTEESSSGRRSVSRSKRASAMSRSTRASVSAAARAAASSPPCPSAPSASASALAAASMRVVAMSSSNWAYASNTSEKSRTVLTVVAASSYTSRACSNCPWRRKKSARAVQICPTSSENSRRPPRIIASPRTLPAHARGCSAMRRQSRSHRVCRELPLGDAKPSRSSTATSCSAASPTLPTDTR